ncbi:MAG: ATP-grasp domain-containing protein [Brevundimonas sp.]
MTSAGGKIPLLRAVRDAARRIDPGANIVAGDIDPDAPSRYLADGFWRMPELVAPDLETIISECRRRDVRTILPTRDGELAFWADSRPALEAAGISVIVSPPEGVALCLDKLAFAEWGKAAGLPVIPASRRSESCADPSLVVKERFGAGSRSIGVGLSPLDARRHATGLADPLFQPLVTGFEISIDAWLTAAGAVHGLVLRRRDRVVNGESQTTTTFGDARLEAQAAGVLERLDLSGPVVMQAIVTETGLAVIEVNARFGGASTASLSVGLDMLYWSLFERAWPGAPLPAFDRRRGEIRQVRVSEDIVIRDPDL